MHGLLPVPSGQARGTQGVLESDHVHSHSKEGSWLREGGVVRGSDSPADPAGCPSLPLWGQLVLFQSSHPGLILPHDLPLSVPQVMRHDSSSILELDGKEMSVFTPSQPREKWQRKRTHVKLRVRVLGRSGPRSSVQSGAGSHCCELSHLSVRSEAAAGREERTAQLAPSACLAKLLAVPQHGPNPQTHSEVLGELSPFFSSPRLALPSPRTWQPTTGSMMQLPMRTAHRL